ncbi:MAG: hypothetical protein ACREL2_09655 [Gemmatimonadales bacterium]
MTLTRLLVSWGVVAVWYAAADAGLEHFWPTVGTTFRLSVIVVEALLLTLFAALWFGSLGHGEWWLLFLVLGIFVEGPVRARHRSPSAAGDAGPWHGAVLAIARLVIAGGLLSWTLS